MKSAPAPRPLTTSLIALALASAFAAGCDTGEGLESRQGALYGATQYGDFSRPEIGRIAWRGAGCVGTLVDPQIVLTAAHCVGYWAGAPHLTYFYVETSYQTSYGFQAGFIINLGHDAGRLLTPEEVDALPLSVNTTTPDGRGNDDLALVVLRSPVPAWLARPAFVVSSYPEPNLAVGVYGASHSFRLYNYTAGPRQPGLGVHDGDSGGPHILLPPPRAPGEIYTPIFGLTSMANWWGDATLANVVHHYNRIQQGIAQGRVVAAELNVTTGPGSF